MTILDRDNTPVAFLGDNPQKAQWANYQLLPEILRPQSSARRMAAISIREANIYVSDWNQTGRVTKLARIDA